MKNLSPLFRISGLLFALFTLLSAENAEGQVVDTVRTDTASVSDTLTIPRTREDSIRVGLILSDSLRADSLRAEAIKRRAERMADTIKIAIVSYRPPPDMNLIKPLRWNREELLSSGAVNIADLLDEVPGVATFRTSWFPGMHTAAYQGDFRRVRVFMDGIELDAPDVSNNGVLDLTEISLFSLDEVIVERVAGEVRVWLKTWTVTHVTPYTRTDVYTGDLNTNGFRGLFGRRWLNGTIFQMTIVQGESTRERGNTTFGGSAARGRAGDGDLRHISARLGWAKGPLSIDGYVVTGSRSRDRTALSDSTPDLPQYDGGRRDAYLRLGLGNPSSGLSAQVLIGHMTTGPKSDDEPSSGIGNGGIDGPGTDDPEQPEPAPDSSRSIGQRLINVSYRRGSEDIGVFGRWRSFDGQQSFSPGFSASSDRGWIRASFHAEEMSMDSSRRYDLSVRLKPISWFGVSLSHSDLSPDSATARLKEKVSRAEGALYYRGVSAGAGFIRHSMEEGMRNITVPRLLTPFDTSLTPSLPGFSGNGTTFTLHAPVYKDLKLDIQGVKWSTGREYRPGTQLRASLSIKTDWLSRFPKGHFGINARYTHEYRGATSFLYPDAAETPGFLKLAEAYNYGSALLEIRIIKATIFYQFRNLYGSPYTQVAGVPMPPPFQTYGVRWEWFN